MNKNAIFGLLAIVLVFGVFIVGCEEETDPSPVTKISISGITGKTGLASIMLYSSFTASSEPVAGGQGTISGNSLTDIPMQTAGGGGWDGQAAGGSYMIFIVFSDDTYYAYTGGRTFSELGITTENDLNTKLPKLYVGLFSDFYFSNFKDLAELDN